MGGVSVKKTKYRVWLLLTVLWTGLIFLQSALPFDTSRTESSGLLAFVQIFLPWMSHNMLRKAAHFIEFCVLGVFMSTTFRYMRNYILIKPLFFTLAVALCDESIQLFSPGRAAAVQDVWLDFSGAVFGALIVWLIYKLRRK